MVIKSLQELVYYFQPERDNRPILLLGAGASFKAGIPVAAEMVRQIARYSYGVKEGLSPDHSVNIMEGDLQRHLKQQSWYKDLPLGELFPLAVEHLLTPAANRKDFFASIISRASGPTGGHEALADLVQRQLVQTVLTTNFDSLIEDALRARQPQIRSIVSVNKAVGDMAAFSPYNKAQVIYLHGAFEYYRDRNSIKETQRMENSVVAKVRPLIAYAPLIVIGYRGFEPSIMDHLLGEGVAETNQYAHGVFWCVRNPADIHPNVNAFADKIGSNFTLVKIDGFDEALAELNTQLNGRAAYQGAGRETGKSPELAKTYDLSVCDDKTLDNLETDQVVAMAKQYATSILKIDFKVEELDRFLESYSFAKRGEDGIIRPTLGLYLLAGKDVTDQNQHLKTVFLRDGKHQTVFSGNLLKQFADLREFLFSLEVNPVVRVKRPDGAVEISAYHERSILELLVNMMAHRDYDSKQLAKIEYETGQHIRFSTPGGLPAKVFGLLAPKPTGEFTPKQNTREIRNPVISDVFFSQGIMDKAGTGLVDAVKFMEEHYGTAHFSVGSNNDHVYATLVQAKSSGDAVAQTVYPIAQREIFLTNLFPFVSIPSTIYSMPLDRLYDVRPPPPFFPPEIEDPARQLVFVKHGGSLHSFSDFRKYELFAKRVGHIDYVVEREVTSFTAKPDERRIFVQLLGRHWERFLKAKSSFGFNVDYKRRRAYFLPKDGQDNVYIYDSPQRKRIQRAVVKKRETSSRVEFENEGITYSVVQFGQQWAIQTKPFYVFTKSDGVTPVPGIHQTRKATRRYKFDRNKAVEADMKFWSIFLGESKTIMDLGQPETLDLILSAKYLEAEAMEL
jgi:hypothetical protein